MEVEITKRSKFVRTTGIDKTARLEENLVIDRALANPKNTLKQLLKGDLFMFLKYFWPEYSQDTFKPNWHIKYLCSQLQKVAQRVANEEVKKHDLVINVPPGSTKTAVVSIMFPLWCWTNWFWMRFITASYTNPLSLESAEYSRDVMRSDKFKDMFPELEIKQDKDTKSNFRIVKLEQVHAGHEPRRIRGGSRFSTSVGGTVTGFHGHILIVDDPIDPQRAISDTEIKKANHWMDNTLPFRKIDKGITPTILIMQRLHQNDPTGHWLRIRQIKDARKGVLKKLKHICIPGEIKNYKDLVSPKKLIKRYSKDGLLDPVRLDWDALKDFELLGQYTYGGQVGQNPVPLGGGMFKVDHFSVVESLPHYLSIEKTVRYWDKAGTKGGGTFTVGVKMALAKDKTIYIVDVKRGQWSTETRERIIRETAIADGKNVTIYIEQEPGSGGKESAEATIKNLMGFSIYKDRPVGDKVKRADPYSVYVNNGNVRVLRAFWNDLYFDELGNFPNSTFKDQTDASSGCFAKLSEKKKVIISSR